MKTEWQMRLDWLEKKDEPEGICIHCNKSGLKEDEGRVCDECYNSYTAGMLADLEG